MASSNCITDDMSAVVRRLTEGGIAAVPTETVYGLAADATCEAAVAAIYRAKGRPDFNPLIVHVRDMAHAGELADFPPLAERLAKRFWPGPLTLVLPRSFDCPVVPAVTAGLATVAVRSPAHPALRAVLEQSGLALAAPSANPSGAISPTTAAHVARGLGAAAGPILDGGPSAHGLESTIVAVTGDDYAILRPGPIPRDALEQAVGRAPVRRGGGGVEAPGQLASHYAPSRPLRLNADRFAGHEFGVGFGALSGDATLSASGDPAEAAARLFACLHEADASGRPAIAVARVPAEGIGAAINDRLARAATPAQ